jgi:hypothetical protein
MKDGGARRKTTDAVARWTSTPDRLAGIVEVDD